MTAMTVKAMMVKAMMRNPRRRTTMMAMFVTFRVTAVFLVTAMTIKAVLGT
jgi:hypothetical protein